MPPSANNLDRVSVMENDLRTADYNGPFPYVGEIQARTNHKEACFVVGFGLCCHTLVSVTVRSLTLAGLFSVAWDREEAQEIHNQDQVAVELVLWQ